MKRNKIAISIFPCLIGLLAFIGHPPNTQNDPITFFYTADSKFIGSGDINHLIQSEVTSWWNWTLINQGESFSNGEYLAAITYEEDVLTKQQAINAVWSYYASQNPDSLPEDGLTIYVSYNGCLVPITIRRKATNN